MLAEWERIAQEHLHEAAVANLRNVEFIPAVQRRCVATSGHREHKDRDELPELGPNLAYVASKVPRSKSNDPYYKKAMDGE